MAPIMVTYCSHSLCAGELVLLFARAGPLHKDTSLVLSLSDGEFQYRIPRLQTPPIMVVLVRYGIGVWVWGGAFVHDTKDRADSRNHLSWWQKFKFRHYFSCIVVSNNSLKRTVWKYHEQKPNEGAFAVNDLLPILIPVKVDSWNYQSQWGQRTEAYTEA